MAGLIDQYLAKLNIRIPDPEAAQEPQKTSEKPPAFPPALPKQVEVLASPPIKGEPLRVFSNQALNALSDVAINCRQTNGLHVEVLVSGTTPSATISVEGASEEGGNYLALPDPSASQAGVAAAKTFDVVVGSAWAKVRLASISGTFAAGQGYTVGATPFRMPSVTRVEVQGIAGATAQPVSDAAMGATTDAVASISADEDTTARTAIGLWKALKNLVIDLKGLLNGGLPAALAASGGLKVEGVSGGQAQPVSFGTAVPDVVASGGITMLYVAIRAGTSEPSVGDPADAKNAVRGLGVLSSPLLYNGATFDRARSIASSGAGLGVASVGTPGEAITLLASAARTVGSGTSTPVTGLGWRRRYAVQLDVTAAATLVTDTLDAYLDLTVDGTNYVNVAHFTQVLGNGGVKRFLAILDSANPGTAIVDVSSDLGVSTVRPSSFGSAMRVRYTIAEVAGASASFTFGVVTYAT